MGINTSQALLSLQIFSFFAKLAQAWSLLNPAVSSYLRTTIRAMLFCWVPSNPFSHLQHPDFVSQPPHFALAKENSGSMTRGEVVLDIAIIPQTFPFLR